MLFYSPTHCSATAASLPEASPITDLNLRNLPNFRDLIKPSVIIWSMNNSTKSHERKKITFWREISKFAILGASTAESTATEILYSVNVIRLTIAPSNIARLLHHISFHPHILLETTTRRGSSSHSGFSLLNATAPNLKWPLSRFSQWRYSLPPHPLAYPKRSYPRRGQILRGL